MTTKRTAVRLLGAAMMTLAIAPWVGGGSASAITKAAADISVKDSQVPTTAEDVANQQTDCPGFVEGGAFDVWHFVLDGNTHDFVELTAEFSTGNVTITSFGPPSAKHAYVQTPAGSVLNDAYADVTPNTNLPGDFQLSHVCVGTPPTTTSAPATTTTSAPATTTTTATTSAPVTTTTTATTSAPATTTTGSATTTTAAAAATTATSGASVLPTKVEASESAAEGTEVAVAVEGTKTGGGQLAATGSGLSVGMALAVSLGLLLGGAALLAVPGRLAVERGRHRRRH